MGKDLKGKELGKGISQESTRLYSARFVDRFGKRSIEYRYSEKEWRSGEPKSKSGYRTIPLTEEAVIILKNKKKRIKGFIGGIYKDEIRNRWFTKRRKKYII